MKVRNIIIAGSELNDLQKVLAILTPSHIQSVLPDI